MSNKLLLFLFFLLPFLAIAQTVPEPGFVFNDEVIPRIDVSIVESDLTELLAEGNEFSNDEYETTIIFSDGTIADTLEQVGFRLRGNTSRLADKKSFKISFNTFVPGRKYHGLEKLNINGSHNDPTNARVKIALDIASHFGLSAPRSNHVELYINDDYFGLYTNVEHIDENFVDKRYGHESGNLYKCLWPADLDYLGSNPNSYKLEQGDRRVYQLKTNTDRDDYTNLAHFIDVLNNTSLSDLPCELEKVFNVDNYLKAMAYEILIGHWDNYIFNKNNFYIYHNVRTNKFEYIVFDVDNTLGINWLADNYDFSSRNIYSWALSGAPRPLYNRILDVELYKDRFSFYINQLLNSSLLPYNLAPVLTQRHDMILSYMLTDPLYPLDYGFTIDDFNASFEESVGYWWVPDGILSFAESRHTSANQQLQLNPIGPVITEVASNHPPINESLHFEARVEGDAVVSEVQLNYQINGGAIISVEMHDDGLHQDGEANDGLYATQLTAVNDDTAIAYFIEATDDSGNNSIAPLCDFQYLYVGTSSLPLKINEVMSSNSSTIADESGEYDDWIELHNYGNQNINLKGKYISDNPELPYKWQFNDIIIQSGGYLLIWADKDQEQGDTHTNFKLAADGESVVLTDNEANNFAQIDRIDYPTLNEDQSFHRLPNGTGPWSLAEPSPGYSNDPTSTNEINLNQLEIRPNPARDQVHISTAKFSGALTIKISSMDGIEVYEKTVNSYGSNYSIDVTNLPSGVYNLEVHTEEGVRYSGKMIRQ